MLRLLVAEGSDRDAEALRACAPGVDVLLSRTPEETLALVPDADALFGGIRPEVIRAGGKLRWVQAGSAGVDRFLFPELRESPIVLTNARGVYAPALADHTMALLLALARRLPHFLRRQGEELWDHEAGEATAGISGRTLLIVGLGTTGQELARRAAAFGMRVVGTRRRPGAPAGVVDAVHPPEALHTLLSDADYVSLSLPLTPATQHLFGAHEFGLMKRTAFLTNVSRGAIVDTDALVAALQAGEIAGAGLDVTEPEPLPAGHPLWRLENVILTPHVAGYSPDSDRRLLDLVCDNLRRFASGRPLVGVVDKAAGY